MGMICWLSPYHWHFKIYDIHRYTLCFTQFTTRIYWNRSLAASDIFYMFTQSVKYYSFHCPILKSMDV